MNEESELPIQRSGLKTILQPVLSFLAAESAGGIVLMSFTVIALIWSNSPWHESYHNLWHTPVSIGAGTWMLILPLEAWVNDALMAVFFLLVGLEIKRELLIGELASIPRAALPVAAALGGMIVPALFYALFNHGTAGSHGWGVPMATDIAFAVGVITLVGKGMPVSLKIFLLAIAIVDDLGAVIVIAFFYTDSISYMALGAAGVFFAGAILLNVLRVTQPWPYLVIGVGLWVATFYSGIHATIAGVLLAFTIPANRPIEEAPNIDHSRKAASNAVQSTLHRVEHSLLGVVNFGIIPLFALANAGVTLHSGIGECLHSHITLGVLSGLVLGKPIGVLLASWLAVRIGLAKLPDQAGWNQIFGVACLCGIGFTMSIFVATLAFPGHPEYLMEAKLGILAASVISGILGAGILIWSGKRRAQ